MRALVAMLAIGLAACSMRDTRFDGVPESHFLGRTEADITKEYGAPARTMWRAEFDRIEASGPCATTGARVDEPGLLQIVGGGARIYRNVPTRRGTSDVACEACFTELVRASGEATLLRRLYEEGRLRSAWKQIGYRVTGDGGGLFDQTFTLRFDLNGACTLAFMATDD